MFHLLSPSLLLPLLLATSCPTSVTSRGVQGHPEGRRQDRRVIAEPSSKIVDVADPCKAGEFFVPPLSSKGGCIQNLGRRGLSGGLGDESAPFPVKNSISIGSSVSPGLTGVPDTQKDRSRNLRRS